MLGWFRSGAADEEGRETEKGMYLDDLISGQVDPATAAIYLPPSLVHSLEHQHAGDTVDRTTKVPPQSGSLFVV